MKRLFAFFFIPMLLFAGCGKPDDGSNISESRAIVLDAKIDNNVSTRTSHSWSEAGLTTLWSDGDKITVFNDATVDGGLPVEFTLASGAGTRSGEFSGNLSANSEELYYAVYPSLSGSRYDCVSFDMTSPQIHPGGLDDMAHMSSHGIMCGSFTEDGKGTVTKPLSFRHLTSAFKFNVVLPEAGKVTLVQFRAKDSSAAPFVVKGTFDASTGKVDETTAVRSNSVCVYMSGSDAVSEVSAMMMFVPVDIAGMTMEAVVTVGGKVYVKEITIPSGKVLKSGVCYNLNVNCTAVTPTTGITLYAAGTLAVKLTGMTAVTDLKINTMPGVELSTADFKAISGALSLKSLDLSGIANKILPGDPKASYFKNLESLILPSLLETIDSYAFAQSEIAGVFVIPASVTKINDYAFQQCQKLTSLVFAERTDKIEFGTYVFESCENLAGEIVFPAQLVNIGANMFSNCIRLSSLKFADLVQPIVIGDSAFFSCSSLKTLTIPGMVTEIGNSSFMECTALTTLVFDNHRTEPLKIGNNAFRSNPGLTGKLIFPEGLTSIGNYAFRGCSYVSDADKTVGLYFTSKIPPVLDGVNSIYGQRVFVANEELKTVYESNASWVSKLQYIKDGKLYVGTVE